MSYGNKSHVLDRINSATEYSPIAIFDAGRGQFDEPQYECLFGATIKTLNRMSNDSRFLGMAHADTPREEVMDLLG